MNLKNQLLIIKDMKDQEIMKLNQDELIENMLRHIGDTDPELRDDLIYFTFSRLVENKLMEYKLMEKILETCIGRDYLFFHIGEEESDSVFTRSFSALAAQLILNQDIKENFLSQLLAKDTIQSSFLYLNQEKDVRGYVKEKGWAHSIAHGADLLMTAISHPLFSFKHIPRALEAVRSCLFKDECYKDDEDERLIFAVEALLDKGMSDEILEDWISSISHSLDKLFNIDGYSLDFYRNKTNSMNFLKSLYFRLGFRDKGEAPRQLIHHIIKKWHDAVYER
ncbi:MAG: DUF2785 domain-containing protein [Heyndrickxia sp.]